MLFLFIIALLCAGGYAVRRLRSRVSSSSQAAARRIVRSVGVAFGEYNLKTVMETMVDDMLDSVLPSISQSYLPNVVTFGLHSDDVRKWGAYFDQLAAELRSLIMVEVERRPDLKLVGELEVWLIEDDAAERGRPVFAAQMRSTVAPQSGTQTTPCPTEIVTKLMPNGETAAAETELLTGDPLVSWGLEVLDEDETRFVALSSDLVVGRGAEATLHLSQRGVSRVHARFTLMDDEVTVVDLGSANGTYLNGKQISMAMLEPGDRIRFGAHAEAELVVRDDRG